MGYYAPSLADRVMELLIPPGIESDPPAQLREQNGLARPSEDLQERGNYPSHVMKSSLYTAASLRPAVATTMSAGAGLHCGRCGDGGRELATECQCLQPGD